MKVAVTLGATLNLGNYNTMRSSITFEDEMNETEINALEANGNIIDRPALGNVIVDILYAKIEDKLIEKIAQFITRLEHESIL